jgi:hypothetical protein
MNAPAGALELAGVDDLDRSVGTIGVVKVASLAPKIG